MRPNFPQLVQWQQEHRPHPNVADHSALVVLRYLPYIVIVQRKLAETPNRICSRDTILRKVWGYEYVGDDRTVDVTISRLRDKIEDNPGEPKYIMTRRGVGYYFYKE